MKITKTSQELTYVVRNSTHKVEINGKSVRIYEHQKQDTLFSDYDNDTEIDERDLKLLTEEEKENLEEYMSEVLELKDGEEFDTE